MKLIQPGQRPEINHEEALALGQQFKAARANLNLSTSDVADKLLLSKQQIEGLESANLKSFYGDRLFAQAAKKYAAFLGLDQTPSNLLIAITAANTIEPAGIKETEQPASVELLIEKPASHRHLTKLLVAIVAIGLISIVGKSLFESNHSTQAPQVQPAQRTPPPQIITPKVEATIHQEQVESIPQGQLSIQFNDTSWVQTVNQSGHKQDKTYRKGDSLVIQPAKLQALIIGNATATEIKSANGTINLKPYMSSGSHVARLIGSQVRQLGQTAH